MNALIEPALFSSTFEYLNYDLPFNSTYQQMQALGFKPKNKKNEAWNISEIALLKSTLKKIAKKKIIPTTACHFYYISHHIFQGSRSKEQVEWMVNQLFRDRLEKQVVS